jgi:hypothetical protein
MRCSTCGDEKPDTDFYRPPRCRTCDNAYMRERRRRTEDSATKRYEKTLNGFLMRAYRNMKSRIAGIQSKKAHLYAGKSLMSREDFYAWSQGNEDFLRLFTAWVVSGYERRISPSVDRIDATRGYEIGNIRWVTFSENCSNVREDKRYPPRRPKLKEVA